MSLLKKSYFLFIYIILSFYFVNYVKCRKPTEINDFLFSGSIEFRDLSHPFNNNTFCLPGTHEIPFSKNSGGTRLDGVWFGEDTNCKSEYTGTQVDSPFYNNTSWSVGNIPFKSLITPVIIIDLNNYVAGNPDFILERHHLDYMLVGEPVRNYTILIRYGWSQYFQHREKYYGGIGVNNYKYPGMSKDFAEWISMNKNLIGVGVDTPSVDPGSGARQGHARDVLIRNNIYIIENVNIMSDLPRSRCSMMVMPIKLKDGTSAPCRVTTICPNMLGHDLF